MTLLNTDAPVAATLTEKELFQCFLDAPIRIGSASTLIAPKAAETTARDQFRDLYLSAGLWPELNDSDLPSFLFEHLCEVDDPEYEMETLVGDMKDMLTVFEKLQSGFSELCNATRTELPDDVLQSSEDNVRYILPITSTDGIKRLAADIVTSTT